MRDAIVLSGWGWFSFNVPERLALSLARSGARVLYCENPASVFRGKARSLTQIEQGVFALGLKFLGHRLNRSSLLRQLQGKFLAHQILTECEKLELKDPIFVYPHGDYCLTLSREFKARGFKLIHIAMDYEPALQIEHVRNSDITLCIPHESYKEFQSQFGEKVRLLPQISAVGVAKPSIESPAPSYLKKLPSPKLMYFGNLTGRVDRNLLSRLLAAHPEWQFFAFDQETRRLSANEHALAWQPYTNSSVILANVDVGVMPYDCATPKNLHCVPLKLFDYFTHGLPVVSTPIMFVQDFQDLVYVGHTPEEFAHAIRRALDEPLTSSKRTRRREIARAHSIDNLAKFLAPLLEEDR